MPLLHLNIGSNLGNRHLNIQKGVDALRRLFFDYGDHVAAESIKLSSFVESAPWGYDSSNSFINIGVNINCSLDPFIVLEIVKKAESSIGDNPHRDADGNYIDRLLDIDIIFYGGYVIDTPQLTIPHPRWQQRDFVKIPLHELNP